MLRKGGYMLDIHAHILPGVDDGAKTHRQALQMLRAARAAGIDVLVATPHLKQPKQDLSRIADAFCWLQPHAQKAGIRLLKGYEVSYKVLLGLSISELSQYCIAGTNILLLELDTYHLFPQWNHVLRTLVQAGYEPVIAHPERYVYIHQRPEVVGKMMRCGCRIQVDADAFLKPPWHIERRTAGKLLRRGWIDYVASDAHRPADYKQMQAVLHKLKDRLPMNGITLESNLGFTSSL